MYFEYLSRFLVGYTRIGVILHSTEDIAFRDPSLNQVHNTET